MLQKIKNFFIFLLVATLFLPTAVMAEQTVEDIDWKEPIKVQLIKQKSNNLFTVQYEDITFDVSMIGIDVADKYTIVRHRQEEGEVIEYNVKFTESNLYNELLTNGDIYLELDKNANLKNYDNVVQAWFWQNGQLVQAKLVGEGRAQINKNICKYTSCDFHHQILKVYQDNAKRQELGFYGAKDVVFIKNVGGKMNMFNFDILNGMDKIYVYGLIGAGILCLILAFVLLIVSFSKRDKTKREQKKQEKLAKKQAKIEAKEQKRLEKEESKDSGKKKGLKEKIEDAIFEPQYEEVEIEVEDKEETTEETKNNQVTNQEENSVNTVVTENISENTTSPLEEIEKEKVMFIKVSTTLFDIKDERSKETPEVINIEYMLAGSESSYNNIFVRPMRNLELTDICKQRTGIGQIKVEMGYLLEEAILKLLEASRDCTKIYAWGTMSFTNLLDDAKAKLTDVDYKRLEYLLEKSVNYKNVFAEKHNTKPCGLVKAIEMLEVEKDSSQVKMMNNLYLKDRG